MNHRIKYIIYSILIVIQAAALFMLSAGILGEAALIASSFALNLACTAAFIAAAASFLFLFITDRKKPLVFPALYIAAVAACLLPAVFGSL